MVDLNRIYPASINLLDKMAKDIAAEDSAVAVEKNESKVKSQHLSTSTTVEPADKTKLIDRVRSKNI